MVIRHITCKVQWVACDTLWVRERVRDKESATCGTLWVSKNRIMSHTSLVIQCVIVKGSDNMKERGSPNDKLRTHTEPVPEVVHSWQYMDKTHTFAFVGSMSSWTKSHGRTWVSVSSRTVTLNRLYGGGRGICGWCTYQREWSTSCVFGPPAEEPRSMINSIQKGRNWMLVSIAQAWARLSGGWGVLRKNVFSDWWMK